MLRLFGNRLSAEQAANLALFLSLSDDNDAREAGDVISHALVGNPFPEVALTDAQREAVRSAIEAAPDRMEWAQKLLV